MTSRKTKKRWSPTGIQSLVRNCSGTYYARAYQGKKQVWQSLRTKQISVAKARLSGWLQEHQEALASRSASVDGKMVVADAIRLYAIALSENVGIKSSTRHYWTQVVKALQKSWPGLAQTNVRRVTPGDCRTWAARYSRKVSPSRYNNTIAALKHIFDHALAVGALFRNPACELKRCKVRPKELELPSRQKFAEFVKTIRTAGAWCSQACGDLVEFLAYTGCRLNEGTLVCWSDVNLQRGELLVRGDSTSGTKNGEVRRIPLIPDARRLLLQIRAASPHAKSSERVLRVRECQRAMNRAAAVGEISRITHHDLRHLFATVCIEAGTDIPTVSRWLGHKDGGVLAMKTYGHLRNEHSLSSAAKIHFADLTEEAT